MDEIRFIHFQTFNTFSQQKISHNNTNTQYVTFFYDDNGAITMSEPHDGTPDIEYTAVVCVKDVSLVYTHGKITQITDGRNFVQYEEFSPVSTCALNAIQRGDLHTVNGISLEEEDVTIDLSLFKVVQKLPTTDILNNKIYLVPATTTAGKNAFSEYIYNDTTTPAEWEMLGTISSEIDLSGYLTKTEADKKYVEKSSNTNTSITTNSTGAMSNFSDNGQAYLAVRQKGDKFLINTPYAAASFGVKDDGTAAFSHKTYATYNKDTGAYTGAKNTAVLQFAGPTGLRYAKNTGNANDVTADMYKYVGVIDSPDVNQKVYSAAQVDELLRVMNETISGLEQRIQELENK